MARKHNVTGIKYLAIGTTKNNRGRVLLRYTVNIPRIAQKHFYFGVNKKQVDAYFEACSYMKESGATIPGRNKCSQIYVSFAHEHLLSN